MRKARSWRRGSRAKPRSPVYTPTRRLHKQRSRERPGPVSVQEEQGGRPTAFGGANDVHLVAEPLVQHGGAHPRSAKPAGERRSHPQDDRVGGPLRPHPREEDRTPGGVRQQEALAGVAREHRRSEERRVGKEWRSRWSPYH